MGKSLFHFGYTKVNTGQHRDKFIKRGLAVKYCGLKYLNKGKRTCTILKNSDFYIQFI